VPRQPAHRRGAEGRRAGSYSRQSRVALFALLFAAPVWAQVSHVAWTVTAEAQSGDKLLLRAAGKIDAGWHLYSASSPAGIPTSFQVGAAPVRIFQPQPVRAFDNNFGTDTETFDGEVVFLVEASGATLPAEVRIRYQTCNETQCVPSRWTGTVQGPAAASSIAIPAGYSEAKPPAPGSTASTPAAAEQGIGAFLAVAFGFGLASIFTPCVFPMIPITMSYFINRQSGLAQAVVFCLGIIVLFTGLGLLMTAVLGPFGIVALGSNPWVNGFITVLFLVFGLSLLGAFEITIPSSILTRLNASSEKGGFAGTLLMGLTFSLASFACVGPFVGTLLAASVSSGGARPLIGMATFATGLSLPFFFLALFPSYLKKLPRSGGWMSRVKVVMGFVILAASLKYLASVDQVLRWGFLTRERFLAAWIVLFAMAGLYLLGFIRLEGIKPDDRMGVSRLLIGMAFVIFAISLFPGMYGARLGDLDAFVPLAENGGAAVGGSQSTLVWMKDQYREALARAKAEGKRVFVNFTGYACANCHWMKANMFTKPEIAAAMSGFVLVELYGDADDATSEANQALQLKMFNTVAQPFYAILDPDEKVIATFPGLTKNPAEFLAFLQKGAAGPAPSAAPAAGPGLSLTSLEGKPVDLAGKVAVVNFWATWCVPCIKEIPSFNKLHREFSSKGVTVVGVSMDEEGAERVRPFLQKNPMEYTVALGNDALAQQFKTDEGIPITVVFDRSGKQVKRFQGYLSEAELIAAVQAAL
jgi:thiol:disulfide interchange protein